MEREAQTNERLGLPSASGYERLVLCRGSWRMEKGARAAAAEDEGDEAAQSGTRIHAYLELLHSGSPQPLPLLNDDEQLCANICEHKRNDVLASWKHWNEFGEPVKHFFENRLFLHDGLEPVFSGKADEIVLCGKRALVLDYKTGWYADEVTSSSQNPQLRALAVLAWQEFQPDDVTVCIIRGRDGAPVEYARYDSTSLLAASKELEFILGEANKDDAPLNPGEKQCKYCAGKLNCPAAQREVTRLATLTIGGDDASRRALLSTTTLVELLDKCGAAEKMIGTIRAEAKRRLENGEAVPGWKLSEGTARRTITNPAKAFSVLNKQYPSLTPEKFAACCTVKVGELDKAVRSATGLKEKEVKKVVGLLLKESGVMETKQSAPALERSVA